MGLLAQYRQKAQSGQIEFDPEQAAAAAKLSVLLNRLKDWKPGRAVFLFGRPAPAPKGIYLTGKVGRGKSMLMDLFFDNVEIKHKKRVHFHEFMAFVHSEINKWRNLGNDEKRTSPNFVRGAGDDPIAPVAKMIVRDAWLLCFDEFQVTDITDAMILGRLFDALWARQCVIVITANRGPREQYKDGINRELFLPFVARLEQEMDIHSLDTKRDYRLERKSSETSYFYPLGAIANNGIDAAWRECTNKKPYQPSILEIDGRSLKVERTNNNCARFDFKQLCANVSSVQTPLGAHDYLAIADKFSAIFIENVPQMGAAQSNEATRFRNLIDTLYNARTLVYISAACPPEELYQSGIQSFEFARTVSRLNEMKSDDYIQFAEAKHKKLSEKNA